MYLFSSDLRVKNKGRKRNRRRPFICAIVALLAMALAIGLTAGILALVQKIATTTIASSKQCYFMFDLCPSDHCFVFYERGSSQRIVLCASVLESADRAKKLEPTAANLFTNISMVAFTRSASLIIQDRSNYRENRQENRIAKYQYQSKCLKDPVTDLPTCSDESFN